MRISRVVSRGPRSRISTEKPKFRTSRMAATDAAEPPPAMMKSYSLSAMGPPSRGETLSLRRGRDGRAEGGTRLCYPYHRHSSEPRDPSLSKDEGRRRAAVLEPNRAWLAAARRLRQNDCAAIFGPTFAVAPATQTTGARR